MEQNKTGKYLKYAIGEIVLVVIGILIALGIGELRQLIIKSNETKLYYQSISENLNQDLLLLDSLELKYKNASNEIIEEVNKLQLDSYNQDSLYSNVQSWMMYAQAFTPNKSTITEILSSGKLHLFKDKKIKG